MENDKQNIVSSIKEFPSMPSAASELLSIIDDPKVAVSKIEDVLRGCRSSWRKTKFLGQIMQK